MKEIQFEGAGFIYLTNDNKVLMLQKSNKKWTFPGGHSTLYETPLETAMRESIEEIGVLPDGKIITHFQYIKPDTEGRCYSFLMKIKKAFKVKLSKEHKDYKWVNLKNIKNLYISKSVQQVVPMVLNYSIKM